MSLLLCKLIMICMVLKGGLYVSLIWYNRVILRYYLRMHRLSSKIVKGVDL